MKRLHVHVSVADLDPAIAFYSALFSQEPTVSEADYAKWEVEDPRVNLAISKRDGAVAGVNHLGIQAGDAEELAELQSRLAAADIASAPESDAHCCYARGDKHWASDPSSVVWEMFHTMEGAATYGEDNAPIPAAAAPKETTQRENAPGRCC